MYTRVSDSTTEAVSRCCKVMSRPVCARVRDTAHAQSNSKWVYILYIYLRLLFPLVVWGVSRRRLLCACRLCRPNEPPPPSWPPQPRSTLILLNWRRLPRCCARLARRRDWAFSSSAHDKFSSCEGRKRGSDAWFKDTRAPEASLWRDAHWVRTGFPSPDRTWRETRVIVGFSWMGKSRALMKSS